MCYSTAVVHLYVGWAFPQPPKCRRTPHSRTTTSQPKCVAQQKHQVQALPHLTNSIALKLKQPMPPFLQYNTCQVNDQKLEEIKAQDGHTYVAMPLL